MHRIDKSLIKKFSNIDSDSDEIVIDDNSISNNIFMQDYAMFEMIILFNFIWKNYN